MLSELSKEPTYTKQNLLSSGSYEVLVHRYRVRTKRLIENTEKGDVVNATSPFLFRVREKRFLLAIFSISKGLFHSIELLRSKLTGYHIPALPKRAVFDSSLFFYNPFLDLLSMF